MVSLVALAAGPSVCRCAAARQSYWDPPTVVPPLDLASPEGRAVASPAEIGYERAVQLELAGDPRCVDAYLEAAVQGWRDAVVAVSEAAHPEERCKLLYHSAVIKSLVTAQRFGRWDASQGGFIAGRSGKSPPEVEFHGFVWQPRDFGSVEPVGDYGSRGLTRSYRSEGLGVPCVVIRPRSTHLPGIRTDRKFAATVVVRANQDSDGSPIII
ncbi:MAG: hypothetical protein AAF961_00765, partial [Planctomycetota bacterium]